MIIIHLCLLFITILQQNYCQELQYMNERHPMSSNTTNFNVYDNFLDDCIIYGLWSRYEPLNQLNYEGLDTSVIQCYNLHNALEINTKMSNFLYYDCLDLEKKTIKKIVQFVDENNDQNDFIIDLDYRQYENIWYYFGISIWNFKKNFELFLMENTNIIHYSNLDIVFPFYDKELIITFGGELLVKDKYRVFTWNSNLFFKTFPGKLYFYPVEYYQQDGSFYQHNFIYFNYYNFYSFSECKGDYFMQDPQIIDKNFKFIDSETRIYNNIVCDSFGLSGWLKGIQIQQNYQNFLYKFIQISINSEIELLTNDNLNPFQLFYRIQNDKLFIQTKTYSFITPSLNYDFSTNPFIIQSEQEIQLSIIYYWHFLKVTLDQNQLIIQITFHFETTQQKLNFTYNVNQFKFQRYKISIGNLFKDKNNYIEMRVYGLYLTAPYFSSLHQACDKSCESCDGPTKNNCLSCDKNFNKIYIPNIQSCVCPENALDSNNGECKDYQKLEFSLAYFERQMTICQYGYFYYDEYTCVKCPSNLETNLISCIDCIQNPFTWKLNPICELSIQFNKSNTNIIQKLNSYEIDFRQVKYFYFYDDANVQFCENCDKLNINNLDQIYRDFSQTFSQQYQLQSIYFIQFCQIKNCKLCQITFEGVICLICSYSQLINGICPDYQVEIYSCHPPYYMDYRKKCKLCEIENCLHCFEYLKNDLSKNTLFKDFDAFILNEFHSIGCALCLDGYQFNFQNGKCIFEKSKIQNCIRSFINLEGIEICTLASSQSFDIAPEIINCQSKIQNCYSCIKTPQQVIMCILCEDGYCTDINSGLCYQYFIENSKKCIEGEYYYNGWIQLLQSFMMQFLDKNYYYPSSDFLTNYAISCVDGYVPMKNGGCEKYCNSGCLKCVELKVEPFGFQCIECPLNYFNQPSRSTDQKNCIVCQKLCSICEPRTQEEIIQQNPYFIVTEDNLQFTHKCIQQIQRNDVYIDSKTLTAKLILEDKKKILNFDILIQKFYISQKYNLVDFIKGLDQTMNQYCNQVGIDSIQINVNFYSRLIFKLPQFLNNQLDIIENNLKQTIFSLETVIFNLIGIENEQTYFTGNLTIKKFDYINITNIDFVMVDFNYLAFQNNFPVYLTVKICSFQSQNYNYGVFSITTSEYYSVLLSDLIFLNLKLIDSKILIVSGEYLKQKIIIKDIIFQNCQFINSSFISVVQNYQDIQIQNLRIENCTFNNSNLIGLNTVNSLSKRGYFQNIQFQNNKFYNCDFIRILNFQQFQLSNVLISNNWFQNSTLFSINSNFQIDNLIIISNLLINSLFLISSDILFNKTIYVFKDLQLKENSFQNTSLFSITPKYEQNSYELLVTFIKLIVQKNQIDTSSINQAFLFYIHCNQLQLYNINIQEQSNIQIIYIYDTFSIQIQQLNFTNLIENIQIPQGEYCLNNFQLLNVIKVFGFNTINLEDFYIKNLYIQDSSILELTSNILFNVDSTEKIQMKNLFFKDNILLKQNNGKRMSLIYIYSEKIQTIILDQIIFNQNLFHQTADDLSEIIAGLIYINSQISETIITNVVSKYNGITNSSCSFLYFTTNSLFISNYQIEGLNIFNEQLLQRYIKNTGIFKQYKKEEIQLIIQKLVSIQTKGSACYATVTELKIMNSIFQNILSYTSPLLELKTEGQGLIVIENLAIRNVDIIYDSNLEFQGSIKIYSLNSQLNLNFINVIFEQVYNKFGSSILSLTPSLRKNRIVFKNVQILNSLSLLNQIMKAEFSDKIKELNFVYFQNVTVIQTEQAWLLYFKKIGQITSEDLSKILNDNALINIVSSTLIVQNLLVQGILQSPVIKILNAVKLQIIQCKFLSIETFYQFNIIQISQNDYYSMKISIQDNEFRYLKLYLPHSEYFIQQLLLDEIMLDQNCQFDNNNLQFYFNSFSFAEIIKLIQSQQNQGSLIYLQSLSNQTKVLIQFLKVMDNYCDFCQQGLISINILQIQKLKIKQFIQWMSQYLKQIRVTKLIYTERFSNGFELRLVWYRNNFYQYKGLISKTLVFNNSAVTAGGMDVNVQNNNFKFQNTQVFQNTAQYCGGIQLNNFSNIQVDNFIQSNTVLNKAEKLANNIMEAPNQLALKINGQIMKYDLEQNDNFTISILKMPAQKIMQLNNAYFSNYLMLPSNQKIIDYKIFDLQTLQNFPYITELSLLFLNSQREQLGNFEEQNCTVFQNIIQLNGAQINQSQLFIISFDTKQNIMDLGNLYFTFDPYEQSQYIQEIEIICNISEYQALSFKFKTKSFYCQLGEFYTNGGCQICDYKFGFYSVSYNATKCSIFDKTKFLEITSNSISLLPGFWRPDYLSDYTELCYQKQGNCLGGWSVGDSSCLQGYLGGLCYECDFYNMRGDGYYFKNLDNDECSLCDDSTNYVMYFVIVSLMQIVFQYFRAMISIFMTLRSIEKTNQLFNNLKVGEKFGKIIFKLNQDHESFLIKMFVNYLWIFSLIFTYNINFSVNLNIVDQASNTSYSMANNLDCFLAQMQEINLVYIRLIATIFFIILQLILVYLIFLLKSSLYKSKFDLSNISNTSLYLYISNNAALTKQFCSLIAKKTISNIDFVQGNMALKFDSISHQNWIFKFIYPGLGINGCFIPFLLILILFLKRNQLDQIKIRKFFCYLFNEYNENNYYWEQIKIWQKTVLIIIMIYFEAEVLLKTTLFGLALIIYQFLSNYVKPYIILSLNKLDYQAGLLCCIAIFLAAISNESSLQNQVQVSNIIQTITAFLCIILIYFFTNNLLQGYIKKYQLVALSTFHTLLRKLSPQSSYTKSIQKILERIYQQKQTKSKL